MIKQYPYPANKTHFRRLIPFAKKIMKLCKDINVNPIIYGSFAHFYHTKDKNFKVKDIDMIIPKKSFVKMTKALEKEKIPFTHYPSHEDNGMSTIVIKKGKLQVELDEIGSGYGGLTEATASKTAFDTIDFYGTQANMVTLKQLEDIYGVAYNRTVNDKKKIAKRIKHLENFLGRKLE